MLGWLYRMLIGSFTSCNHKWIILKERPIKDDGLRIGTVYDCQCEKCGNITFKRFG